MWSCLNEETRSWDGVRDERRSWRYRRDQFLPIEKSKLESIWRGVISERVSARKGAFRERGDSFLLGHIKNYFPVIG